MAKPMTFSRTVEYPVRLQDGSHTYIWAEHGMTATEIRNLGAGMGLDVAQVSMYRKCTGLTSSEKLLKTA
jgi:hypothetical protein